MTKRVWCCSSRHGLGKSTSLAAMIGYRNENSHGHIVTIEDPSSTCTPHRNCLIHAARGRRRHRLVHAALKNTLRQAPDVILIGEILDMEVMEHAMRLRRDRPPVPRHLDANNSNQAMDRIINFSRRRAPAAADGLSLNLKG